MSLFLHLLRKNEIDSCWLEDKEQKLIINYIWYIDNLMGKDLKFYKCKRIIQLDDTFTQIYEKNIDIQ